MTTPDIDWEGASGRTYAYWIHTLDTDFVDEPGNYLFAKETYPGSGVWKPVYIGQASSLRDRLPGHEKRACALRNGATHIHAHTNPRGMLDRKAEEADLIQKWQPTCNEIGLLGSLGGLQ